MLPRSISSNIARPDNGGVSEVAYSLSDRCNAPVSRLRYPTPRPIRRRRGCLAHTVGGSLNPGLPVTTPVHSHCLSIDGEYATTIRRCQTGKTAKTVPQELTWRGVMLEYFQRQPRSGCPRIECASVLLSGKQVASFTALGIGSPIFRRRCDRLLSWFLVRSERICSQGGTACRRYKSRQSPANGNAWNAATSRRESKRDARPSAASVAPQPGPWSSSRMIVGQKATTTWMMWMTERTSDSRPYCARWGEATRQAEN